MNINKSIQLAFEYYQAGNLQQVEHICRKILKKNPKNFKALFLLGAIYFQLGNYDLAIKYIKKTLHFNSNIPEVHYNLGNAFKAKGQLDDAITCYQNALKLNPNFVDAYYNLGTALQDKGQLDDAITCYQNALKLNPNLPDAYYNLGNAFKDKGQLDDAITCYQNALKLNPNFDAAYNNLGIVLKAKGQLDDAITCYQNALKLNPNLPDAYYNLGNVLKDKGQLDDAITCYQNALKLNPNFVDAYYNLGIVLQLKGQFDDAITCYQNALKLNPNFVDAYYNLGIVLQLKGQFDDAITCYQTTLKLNSYFVDAYYYLANILQGQGRQDKALAAYDMALFCKPDYIYAHLARCISHLPIIYTDRSSIQVSRKRYHDELIKLRNTIFRKFSKDIDITARAIGTMQPFYLAYQGFNDRELQQLYGDLVCQIMASRYPQFAERSAMPTLSSEEPLRVGVVSGFFYRHSNWKIPIKGWVENLDRKRFSLYGYYTWVKKDKETEIARQSFSRFVEDIYSIKDLCKIIREDNLHVLIYPEIGMDSRTAQLAALRLAPIQCSSWGHPDTSGFPTIDYFLSSDLMEPPEADDHYTEQLIRLPNLSIYYTPLDVPSVAVNRDTFGLRPKSILYLCCQSLFKYLPQYDEVYPHIAQQVGDCQFLFISHLTSNWITEQLRSRINQAFNDFNLQADDYVVFLPVLDPGKYHAINHLADVYLDSIGWSGCNSTFEALACNLPVVTLPGGLMRGRHSLAILTMMGLTETIATTLDEYVALAVKLGQNLEWRQYISDKISKNKHLAYRDKACITALQDFLEGVVKERLEL
jgi:protein O-GlcNAc transferase